jgi:phosphatidylglycerophosphatase A
MNPSPPPPPEKVPDQHILREPTLRFMLGHPAHLMAMGFGAGLSPGAPGTAGTLWAWCVYALLRLWLSHTHLLLLIMLSTLVGWWACTVTARHLRSNDPGCIVWDEVVAFWAILWLCEPAMTWYSPLLAFGLFRFFDAVKPGPVGWIDRAFKGPGWFGGLGILLDDFVAAACTVLTLVLIRVL